MTDQGDPASTMASMRARAAAHQRWAFEPDRAAATRPAREAFLQRFERDVDPDGLLPAGERARRAQSLRRAYFLRLAAASAAARARGRSHPNDSGRA